MFRLRPSWSICRPNGTKRENDEQKGLDGLEKDESIETDGPRKSDLRRQ
jgi:hypothetical protein